MYYIGTGNTYITVNKNGKALATMNLKDAKMFSSKQKAGQFLVSLPRKLYDISTKWEVKEQGDSKPPEIKLQKNKNPQPQLQENKSENTVDTTDVLDVDYLNILNSVSVLQENKKGCMTCLNSKLSDIGQEIVDLEHYIEFNNLNACETYHAYKMLRDTLRERRKIKDSITAAQSLYENCNVDKLCSCNEYLHNRVYVPRKFNSLFEK